MAASPRIYLDHNATAPMPDAVRNAVVAGMALVGNPSSIHGEGRAARAAVEDARGVIAAALGVEARQVIFTSGGSESAATLLAPRWAVKGDIRHCQRLVVSATEHLCVLTGGRFPVEAAVLVPVKPEGAIDLVALDAALSKSDRPLLALHHANNETGVIQQLTDVKALADEHQALLVVDAVQSFGKVSFSLSETGADALFVSAHKLGGPKGIGAIVFADPAIAPADPLIAGGGQQRGFRAGTENVPGILGFAAAVKERFKQMESWNRIKALRDHLEKEIRQQAPDAMVFGGHAPRLPNTSLFAIPGLAAERALIALDLDGVAVSSGSACSSGKVKRSHVLAAMGVADDLAGNAIRISLGLETSESDVTKCLAAFEKLIGRTKRNTSDLAAAAA
jgi:cysteine desulfurase